MINCKCVEMLPMIIDPPRKGRGGAAPEMIILDTEISHLHGEGPSYGYTANQYYMTNGTLEIPIHFNPRVSVRM